MQLHSHFIPAILRILLSMLLLTTTSSAAGNSATTERPIREYTLNISYMTTDPTNSHPRQTIVINNQFPPPTLYATVGDRLIVTVYNHLPDVSTSLHFHGLFQNGTAPSDGPARVTQCAIPPGRSMIHDFVIDQAGTYWYHSHFKGQYPDGFRGPLIVTDPDPPTKDHELYKPGGDNNKTVGPKDITLTLSDWYHLSMPVLQRRFMSPENPTGAEPVPDAALINDAIDYKVSVEAGETYLFRLINIAAFAGIYVWFEGHEMMVVEVDGVYVKPMAAEKVYLSSAQRMGVLVTMKNTTSQNFPIVASMDEDLFDEIPEGLNPNVTAHLVYDSSLPLPPHTPVDNFDHLDDFLLEPVDGFELLTSPDYSFQLNVTMDNLGDGTNYAFFNGITYVPAVVPTLYTVMSAPENVIMDPRIYGTYTNPFVFKHNDVIEVVLNNMDAGKHPFHLHGRNFQVVHRAPEEAGVHVYSPDQELHMPAVPVRRDTVIVNPNGNIVLRFRADNPGVWVFHCHIEWHMDSGLIATFVEAPAQIKERISVPEAHYDICRTQGLPVVGNAAGNNVDWLDLKGQNTPPAPLPKGFTAKGIVALAFSSFTGILGCAVVAWYGMGEVSGELF